MNSPLVLASTYIKCLSSVIGLILVFVSFYFPWGSTLRRDIGLLAFMHLFSIPCFLGLIVEPTLIFIDENANKQRPRWCFESFQLLLFIGVCAPGFALIKYFGHMALADTPKIQMVAMGIVLAAYLVLGLVFSFSEARRSCTERERITLLCCSPLLGLVFAICILMGLIVSLSCFGMIGMIMAYSRDVATIPEESS